MLIRAQRRCTHGISYSTVANSLGHDSPIIVWTVLEHQALVGCAIIFACSTMVVQAGERVKIVGYNWDSLNRHGVTKEMIEEVLISSMVSNFSIDEADVACDMLVGYTLGEKLLEIGLRYTTTDSAYVFHAQAVSPQYRKLFNEEWDDG